MITRDEIKSRWQEVKGRLQEQWGQLTDDDLQQFRGTTAELIGVIQQKTGATKNEIDSFLTKVFNEGESIANRAGDFAQRYAGEASDYAQQNYDRVALATKDFSRQAAHTVRSRPAESMAIAFGVGLAAGALFFMGRRR